jgi:multidrug efflux pump subunit AcrA (membrane-fusion protein)
LIGRFAAPAGIPDSIVASLWGIESNYGTRLGDFEVVPALATLVYRAAKPPETSLVRTALVQPMDNVRPDGEASYLASVKFDHETDLSFKVGGIVVVIGPAANTDWDEGTPVKAGTVLAELKQADFTNALSSARARAELAVNGRVVGVVRKIIVKILKPACCLRQFSVLIMRTIQKLEFSANLRTRLTPAMLLANVA